MRELASDVASLDSHYQATFRLAGSGIARVSADGVFIDVNDQFCEMIGYARDALLGARFQDITFADDLNLNADLLEKLNTGEIGSYRMQKRYIRSNGEILWADLSVSAERNGDGKILSLISIISDIRDFKRNEERMDFLLNELSHRSKNLFTVVLGVINQTQADDIQEFKALIGQRIMGLSASNDLLLGRSQVVSSLSDLIKQQMQAFVAPTDPRIVAHIFPVDLGLNATRVLGMAIHELATNSCKYGALSRLSGLLLLSCEIDQTDVDYVIIRWHEQGGPAVSPPQRSGFGRKVIEGMVARSLNADVQLRFEPEGVEWRCRMRLDDLRL